MKEGRGDRPSAKVIPLDPGRELHGGISEDAANRLDVEAGLKELLGRVQKDADGRTGGSSAMVPKLRVVKDEVPLPLRDPK